MMDGCNLKLCVATHSLASSRTSLQKNFNANARLFPDGFVRKYQLTFHAILHHLLARSSSCTSPHLYSSIPSSLSPIISSLFNVFITPLLYSSLNPFTPSTLYLSLFFCTPHFSHPTRFPYLSIIHYTLYSYSSFPLTLFHHLFSYLSLLLSPPLFSTFTSYTYNTPLYLPPFITSFL